MTPALAVAALLGLLLFIVAASVRFDKATTPPRKRDPGWKNRSTDD
jgi:hypothetical protein